MRALRDGARHVVVVGAGPAGLSATRAAVQQGARVTLLDASHQTGGQYWRHRDTPTPTPAELRLQHQWRVHEVLRDLARTHPLVELVTGAQVWAAEQHDDGPRLHVLVGDVDGHGRTHMSLAPDAVVLATGAHDRTLPFPGWDLPGVVTAGAAQALAKGDGVAVGRRVLVAGAGPFLLPVAATLAEVGTTVVGVHEASRPAGLVRGWLPRPWRLAASRGKALELAGYVAGHVRHRIPYRTGESVVAAHGNDRVEAVTVARLDGRWAPVPGSERQVEVDAVCVSHGFTPRLEVAIALGASISSARFVTVDGDQATSAENVYAAGELTGIGGVDAALAEGWVAGHVAAGGDRSDHSLGRAVSRRRASADVTSRIEAAHGIRPGWTAWLRDDTLVCRCEEVTVGRLRTAVEVTGSSDPVSVKLTSRAGLGICQGRVCGRVVSELLGSSSPMQARPVVTPVRLGDLAATPPFAAPGAPREPGAAEPATAPAPAAPSPPGPPHSPDHDHARARARAPHSATTERTHP